MVLYYSLYHKIEGKEIVPEGAGTVALRSEYRNQQNNKTECEDVI